MAERVQPTPEMVDEVLERAIALMNDSGAHWVQGRFHQVVGYSDEGVAEEAFCSAGAIRRAAGIALIDYGSNDLADAAVEAVARATIPYNKAKRSDEWATEPINIVTGWNDDNDTNWDKVVRRFNRARSRVQKRAKEGLPGF